MQICILAVDDLADDKRYKAVLSHLSPEEKLQVEQCRQPCDRLRSLGARLLLRYACAEWQRGKKGGEKSGLWRFPTLSEVMKGLEGQRKPEIVLGPHGKPGLAGNPFFYNLSHAGNYAAIAWGDREVGLDIQEFKMHLPDMAGQEKREAQIVKRFFTNRERLAYAGTDGMDRRRMFYRIWCRKEAYGKYTGQGLNSETFAYQVLQKQCEDNVGFYDYEALEGYYISMCMTGGENS